MSINQGFRAVSNFFYKKQKRILTIVFNADILIKLLQEMTEYSTVMKKLFLKKLLTQQKRLCYDNQVASEETITKLLFEN